MLQLSLSSFRFEASITSAVSWRYQRQGKHEKTSKGTVDSKEMEESGHEICNFWGGRFAPGRGEKTGASNANYPSLPATEATPDKSSSRPI